MWWSLKLSIPITSIALRLEEEGLEVRRVRQDGPGYAAADTFAPYVDKRTVAVGLWSIMFESG